MLNYLNVTWDTRSKWFWHFLIDFKDELLTPRWLLLLMKSTAQTHGFCLKSSSSSALSSSWIALERYSWVEEKSSLEVWSFRVLRCIADWIVPAGPGIVNGLEVVQGAGANSLTCGGCWDWESRVWGSGLVSVRWWRGRLEQGSSVLEREGRGMSGGRRSESSISSASHDSISCTMDGE